MSAELQISTIVDLLQEEICTELRQRDFMVIAPDAHLFSQYSDTCLLCDEDLAGADQRCQRQGL